VNSVLRHFRWSHISAQTYTTATRVSLMRSAAGTPVTISVSRIFFFTLYMYIGLSLDGRFITIASATCSCLPLLSLWLLSFAGDVT